MTPEAQSLAQKVLAEVSKKLALRERVPAFLRAREWPTDEDLVSAITVVVACVAIGAGGTRIKPPPSARFCGGRWPTEQVRPATQIVEFMQLEELTRPCPSS